jgi:hypothetical protein
LAWADRGWFDGPPDEDGGLDGPQPPSQPGPCHVEQDQPKICAGNGSKDRGDQSHQSHGHILGGELIETTNPMTTEFYD